MEKTTSKTNGIEEDRGFQVRKEVVMMSTFLSDPKNHEFALAFFGVGFVIGLLIGVVVF